MRSKLSLVTKTVRRVLGGKYFFLFILGIASLQGLWYAVSFQPAMYDEAQHFGFTKMYMEHLSPYISHQDAKWDSLGETTREPSFLFYYLMSWPLRILSFFTHDDMVWLFSLRLLCIVFFVASLYYFRNFFRRMRVSDTISHLALFIFILTPGVAILPGVFNYDNLVILLVALLLNLAFDITKEKQINILKLSLFIIIGLLGSVIKFTFLPIYAPVFVYVICKLIVAHKKGLPAELERSYRKTRGLSLVLVGIALVLSTFVFMERVGVNFIKYHSPTPSCVKVLPMKRCLVNDVTKRNILNEQHRQSMGANFQPINIFNYTLELWLPTIIRHHASPVRTLPVMLYLYFFIFIFGVGLTLVYLRDLIKIPSFSMTAIVITVYVMSILLYNYAAYRSQAVPVAMNGRYIFPVLPLLLVMIILSLKMALGKYNYISGVLVIGLILAMTQGGGLITYLLDNYDPVYIKNSPLYEINTHAKSILHPIVKE